MKLWREYRSDPSIENRNRIAEHYMPLAESIAGEYRHRLRFYYEFDEPLSLTSESITRCVDLFDPEMGFQFEAFAGQSARYGVVNEIRRQLGRDGKKNLDATPISVLEQNERECRALTVFPTENQTDNISDLIRGLTKHERIVVLLHYVEGLSFRQIAKSIGVSNSRVSQIHKSAIGFLKRKHGASIKSVKSNPTTAN